MLNHYTPALLSGALISGAVLLDGVITPERDGHPPRVAMLRFGQDISELKALAPEAGHNVWVVKGDGDVEAVSAIAGDAQSIDVEVLSSRD